MFVLNDDSYAEELYQPTSLHDLKILHKWRLGPPQSPQA